MQDFPHKYQVGASAAPDSHVSLESDGMPTITSAPPAEFGGPGDQWSPEHLLVSAVADCFILTFRAVSGASKLDWTRLECSAEGTLDRIERVTSFTAFTVHARLTVPAGTDEEKARRLLQKSEDACLITSSLKADSHLEAEVVVEG